MKIDIKNSGLQPIDESEEYDLEEADKKQKIVAYLTKLLSKDLEYTMRDVERIQKRNDEKALGASEEVQRQADLYAERADSIMANLIKKLGEQGAFDLE